MRSFFLFCFYLVLLSAFGITTILYNFKTKNVEYDEGIRGATDFVTIVSNSSHMVSPGWMLRHFDMWIFNASFAFGLLGAIML